MFWRAGNLDAGLFDKVLMSWTELNVKHPAVPCCELTCSKCLQQYLELVLYVQGFQSWIEHWKLGCSALHKSCALGEWMLRNWYLQILCCDRSLTGIGQGSQPNTKVSWLIWSKGFLGTTRIMFIFMWSLSSCCGRPWLCKTYALRLKFWKMFIVLQTEHADSYYDIIAIVLVSSDMAVNNLWNVVVILAQGV